MTETRELNELPIGGLAAYKNQPGRIRALEGKKVLIELIGGEAVNVRPKDISLLHPGPVDALPGSSLPDRDVYAAWELMAGESTTIDELAELIYGEWTPSSAWAVFLLLTDGLYFRGEPDMIIANTIEEVNSQKALRQEKAQEEKRWIRFLDHMNRGVYGPSDEKYLRNIENFALGRSDKSKILGALDQRESPESAHALLLRIGYWDETVNPYPTRGKVATASPAIDLPHLPDEDRLDLTHLAAFAIDDEGSRDPDDAISFDEGRLWVHIADVGALIAPGSLAEEEARARGANLYLPEGTVTMLPPSATELLGIGLKDISPALSFGIELDQSGNVVDVEIRPSWIRASRLTYLEAEEQLGAEPFRDIEEICSRFRQRRASSGAIEIELPEVRVRVIGDEVAVEPLQGMKSRDLVKEAMLIAGNGVAHFMRTHAIPVPFVAQERPTAEIQRATTMSEMFALRRSMKPGRYTSTPSPHAGLGLDLYVQATSPLRRYLDMLVHQQLRSFLRGEQLISYQDVLLRLGSAEAVIPDLRAVERRSIEHWKLVYLLQNPGWQGEGFVVENTGSHALVLLPGMALETRIYQKQPLPLDHRLHLELVSVDLPNLIAHFRPADI